MQLITDFFVQLLATVGVIALFGLLIAFIRHTFCALCPKSGPRALLITGIVGTPIHELSHALMCLIFGHKITDIKLYQPQSQDGSLGYVSHKYNKRNLYHRIGNFFIGTAPVVIGGAVVVLLMALLLPSAFDTVSGEARELATVDITALPVSDYFAYIGNSISSIFSSESLSGWQGWLFVLLAIMIASHMELSGADVKNSTVGFLFLALLLFLFDGVLFLLFPDLLVTVTEYTVSFGLILSAFLSISIIFLCGLLILGLIFKGIAAIFTKK